MIATKPSPVLPKFAFSEYDGIKIGGQPFRYFETRENGHMFVAATGAGVPQVMTNAEIGRYLTVGNFECIPNEHQPEHLRARVLPDGELLTLKHTKAHKKAAMRMSVVLAFRELLADDSKKVTRTDGSVRPHIGAIKLRAGEIPAESQRDDRSETLPMPKKLGVKTVLEWERNERRFGLPAPVTAARLAAETGVSRRQLYRDIATLRAGGALIDGEAGVGYRLTEDPALPPQSFSRLEIEALVLAVGELRQTGDAVLEAAGRSALARIIATLADGQSQHAMHTVLRSFRSPPARADFTVDMSLLRRACWEELALDVSYRDLKGRVTEREVWPLGISYSEGTLMLLVWCCLRQGWRVFHASGIEHACLNGRSFRPRRVFLLRDYAAQRDVPGSSEKA